MVVRITSFPKSDVAFFHWFDVVQPRLLHGGILNPNLLKMSPRVFIVIWKVQGSAFGVRSSAFLVFSVQGFFHEICVIGVICGWIVLEFSRYFVPTAVANPVPVHPQITQITQTTPPNLNLNSER
jgi:hypothetical protein